MKPGFPRMVIAINIKTSGKPSRRTPDKTAFHSVDKFEPVTMGINKGNKKPDIKIKPPKIKRGFDGDSAEPEIVFIISLFDSLIIDYACEIKGH